MKTISSALPSSSTPTNASARAPASRIALEVVLAVLLATLVVSLWLLKIAFYAITVCAVLAIGFFAFIFFA